ncbi:Glutamate synthase [NADPH] large chain [Nymphon striatum]|nr:Glutamate synthase [NADPH] large chain [Nymphon striatum]
MDGQLWKPEDGLIPHRLMIPLRANAVPETPVFTARTDSQTTMASLSLNPDLPRPQGLYSPENEHDSCGVSFVVHLKGEASHNIVDLGVGALCNMEHRGAQGAEVNTGDGAGIMIQVPDKFFRDEVDFVLPPAGEYAGIGFLPKDPAEADKAVLGWRDVPVNPDDLGSGARNTMPLFRQVFASAEGFRGIALDRLAYVARKRIEHQIHLAAGDDQGNEAMGTSSETHDGIYFPSLSARTFIYKGMLTTSQLAQFYPDLQDPRVESAMALVHSRFTHNGEINTVKGNRNWMRAREALLASDHLPEDLDGIFPICTPGHSDTAGFDEALELLVMGGYTLPEAILMMIPEPWERHESMPQELTDFYRFHASIMEPWDGPASIAFTDGTLMGAVLDRNGLRPSRYWVTDDDLVIMASEVGVVDVEPSKVVEKGRLQPGRMFLIDTSQGRIIRDDEIKAGLASKHPYGNGWSSISLPERPARAPEAASLEQRQLTFGYTLEELRILVAPMARDGKEALGSMGTDTPVAVLSNRSRMLYDYFQQLFAQVTNPPLDAIREEIVTATFSWIGPERNLLDRQPESCQQIFVEHPVITSEELASIVEIEEENPAFSPAVISCLYPVAGGGAGLRAALAGIRSQVSRAVAKGKNIIILSDRDSTRDRAPMPMLLVAGAVHHHLVNEKSRSRVGLVIETGEMREIHHLALLLGFGANAVNPYLAFESIDHMTTNGDLPAGLSAAEARNNYVKACDKGVLKVMSKMGISTVRSYIGAQIFEAIGLGDALVDECFTGTISRLGGIGFDEVAAESAARHALAYPDNEAERAHRGLEAGGEYQWRREGEYHLFNPETVFKLQHATREKRYDIFGEYTGRVNDQSTRMATLRGLFKFNPGSRQPIPIDQVEPVSEIVKRFSTGAMSYGSISQEAHQTLAIAMNRIGAKSNTGEGGEDADRFTPDANGDLRRSSIKQAASGRFGVTSEYLVNADDIQIKMAQGAKPGEGGQLPAHKVWPWIAKTRHSTPGVGLISPPPHHDIYSIEDLAQLIHDLKNANPEARVHVKLVSELGVGTVAAGVSKAHADVVLISGHDGGTGASPLTSMKHAGTPWELGLAETQQTLLLNNLRDRIVVQVDGQLKTGRDVMIAALLGGEEFGFATAPLVVMGCVMMRVCHLDTCPVGVATQDPELRKKFSGKPEFVVNFMEFIAEEVRELLAELGFRTLAEAVGRSELLDVDDAVDHLEGQGPRRSPHPVQPAHRRRCRPQVRDHPGPWPAVRT